MKSLSLLLVLLAAPAAAQSRPSPIPQPTRPAGVADGSYGPQTPKQPASERSASARAARSDTTEILEAVARKLDVKARDVTNSQVLIEKDTAWVSLMNPRFRGLTIRLERHHSWKVLDQTGS